MKNPSHAVRLKICILVPAYPCHQADRQVPWLRDAVERLASRHQVTVIAPSYRGLTSHTIDQVPVRRFRYAPKAWEQIEDFRSTSAITPDTLRFWMLVPYVLFGTLALTYWAWRERFDVIDVRGVFPNGLLTLLPRLLLGTKVVATCDEHELQASVNDGMTHTVRRWLLRQADGCTASSLPSARQIKAEVGRDAVVIPYGPDPLLTGQLPALRPVKPADEVAEIVFCCHGADASDLDGLIRALSHIAAKRRVHLAVIGDRNRVVGAKALSFALGLRQMVTFVENVETEELSRLCRTCDIYVHAPSSEEQHLGGSPHADLMAAMLNERPIVTASPDGGLIEDNVTGLVLPDDTPVSLANAILRLLANPLLAMRLGRKGRRFAEHYFDWTHITDQTVKSYREVSQKEQFGADGTCLHCELASRKLGYVARVAELSS